MSALPPPCRTSGPPETPRSQIKHGPSLVCIPRDTECALHGHLFHISYLPVGSFGGLGCQKEIQVELGVGANISCCCFSGLLHSVAAPGPWPHSGPSLHTALLDLCCALQGQRSWSSGILNLEADFYSQYHFKLPLHFIFPFSLHWDPYVGNSR